MRVIKDKDKVGGVESSSSLMMIYQLPQAKYFILPSIRLVPHRQKASATPVMSQPRLDNPKLPPEHGGSPSRHSGH